MSLQSWEATSSVLAFFITWLTCKESRDSQQYTGCEIKIRQQQTTFNHDAPGFTLFIIGVSLGCNAIHCSTAMLNLWLAHPMRGTLSVLAILWLMEQLSPTRQRMNSPYHRIGGSLTDDQDYPLRAFLESHEKGLHGWHHLYRNILTVDTLHICCCDTYVIVGPFRPTIKYNNKLGRKLILKCVLCKVHNKIWHQGFVLS